MSWDSDDATVEDPSDDEVDDSPIASEEAAVDDPAIASFSWNLFENSNNGHLQKLQWWTLL